MLLQYMQKIVEMKSTPFKFIVFVCASYKKKNLEFNWYLVYTRSMNDVDNIIDLRLKSKQWHIIR